MLTLFCKQNDRKCPKSSGVCFNELLDGWLAETGPRVKRSTLATYERALEHYIRPELGGLDTELLTDAELGRFLTRAAEQYSASTVRLLGCVLRSALEYAHGRGLCRAVEGRLPRLSAARQEARILSREEQQRLLDSLEPGDTADKLGLLLCLYTGMRLGEACGLRWGDVSPDCSTIYIRRTLQRLPEPGGGKTALVLDTPKSRSSARAIPVPARLRPMLEAARGEAGCYVLTGQETPMEPRRFQRRFKSALRGAGVADINFHALRHTFATNCVSLGCDAATLARILGHSDVAITLNTYVHPSFEAMRAIVDRNCGSA